MKKLVYTHKFQLFILFLIPFFIAANLLSHRYVFGGAEEGVPFYNIENTIQVYSNIWVDQVPGYPLIFEAGKIPFLTTLLIISKISPSPAFISSAYAFIFMFLGCIGMYSFTLVLLKGNKHSRFIACTAAIFYLLNPFSMAQIWGRHLSMQMYPFAFIPGFLALIIGGLIRRNFNLALLGILFSVVLGGAFNHPSYVISLFFLIAFYFVIYAILNKNQLRYVIIYAVRTGGLFIFANSFWILPYIAQLREPNDFIGNSDNLSIFMGLSQYFPLSTILTLRQKYYFNIAQSFGPAYISTIFSLITLLLPFILVIGLFKIREVNKTSKVFILIIFFIALFICAGGNRPFGPIMLWFINSFPILEIYRNSYEKFGLIFTIFYSIIFSFGFYKIYNILSKKGLILFFILLIVTIFGIYLFPIWDTRAFQEADATNEPPEYYEDFVNWSKSKENIGRVLLTPILPGDATTQAWNSKQYRGIDISPFILSEGTLTREIPGLFGNNFTNTLRKQIQQQDVSEVLKALRIKYIVNRGDIVFNDAFAKHINYLTKETNTPTPNGTEPCEKPPKTQLETNIFYACSVKNSDLSAIKFIHLGINTNEKVALEVRLFDKNGLRTRWDGKTEEQYRIDENTNEVVLPVGIETELPEKFSYKDVVAVEVSYFPVNGKGSSKVFLNSIKLDKGTPLALNKYQKTQSFGKLEVYETKEPIFEEIRSPQYIKTSKDLKTFFTSYKADKEVSYIVKSEKHSDLAEGTSNNILLSFKKESPILYTAKFSSEDEAYLWLSKSMNSSWKVIPGSNLADADLLSGKFISENNHFLADGYANLWKVQGSKEYTLVYLPAIFVRLGIKITKITSLIILLYLLAEYAKTKYGKNL